MSRKLIFAHLAILGANIIYGLNYVIAKDIMPDYLEPRAIIFLRVAGASAVFWLVSVFGFGEKVARKDLIRLGLISFLGVGLNQIMFFEGLNLTTPINASVIMVGIPILVLVFSHFFIGDRLTSNKLIGILLGFLGAAYLIFQSGPISFKSDTFVGNLFIFINATAYSLYLVLVKPLMVKYHPLTIMKWVFLFGLFYITPFTINLALTSDYSVIPLSIWLSIGFVIIFTTIFAYFLNNYSLKTISPTINSAYIFLQPVVASLVALIFAKDHLSIHTIISAGMIFIGVYFVSFKKTNIN